MVQKISEAVAESCLLGNVHTVNAITLHDDELAPLKLSVSRADGSDQANFDLHRRCKILDQVH